MCGICGVIDLRGAGRASQALVAAMTRQIVHRGPDGDGFHVTPDVVFGMRRLSIIDVAGSDQPLTSEDGQIALVFNGEIYNYRELRTSLAGRGHSLRTEGDGETLAHLYEDHGQALFAHLRGMYALALHDAARGETLLATDHIGMKPLYLWEHDGLLHFASEVKCFRAHPAFQPEPDLDVLDTYLSFGYMIGGRTLFSGVRRLLPGEAAHIRRGDVRITRHWQFGAHARADVPPGLPDAAQQARDLLQESVRLHLRSDVPLGLFLSGGVDSASVLALMAREAGAQAGERVKTYTVGYAAHTPDNELAQARAIAAHFGADHHERVISAEDWWSGFERYIVAHDEPNANPSAVSLLLLAEHTARDVRVVLTGLGGDELFCGYRNHRVLPPLLARGPATAAERALADALGGLERFYPAFRRYRGLGALPTILPPLRHRLLGRQEGALRSQSFDALVWSDGLRARLYGPALRQAAARGHRARAFADVLALSERGSAVDTAQALVINTWLPGNALLNADKVTMASSLEARVPFFDPALLDFAAGMPEALKTLGRKQVLREAMRPYLPAFALERPKQPFGTPILGWFAGPLAARIDERLRDASAFIRPLFDARALDALLRGHFSGRAPQVEVVFRLLTLEMWAQAFVRPPAA